MLLGNKIITACLKQSCVTQCKTLTLSEAGTWIKKEQQPQPTLLDITTVQKAYFIKLLI